MACALVVATITLILPLCARYITKNILESGAANALTQIYTMGTIMVVLVIIHALCNAFVDYQGHMMGTLMERDMRNELFAHYQKLSHSFYDDQRTGQLMSRITHDTYNIGELYHHAPEDLVLTTIKFFGVFMILLSINVQLTLILFLFLPIMAVYAFYFSKRMNRAFRAERVSIGNINAQVEDALSGIRVVKSFSNEEVEQEKFARQNNRFVASRRDAYFNEAYFYNGMVAFTQLFTVAVVVLGGASIVKGSLSLSDLVTYLLYAGIILRAHSHSPKFYQVISRRHDWL